MKSIKLQLAIIPLSIGFSANAPQKVLTPDLSKVRDAKIWASHNREVTYKGDVYLNAQPGDGFVWLKDLAFNNGKIELDIKGKDENGRSFVGLAFHGLNDSTYDAIYFRPFNFKNPERNRRSIQYVSHPEHTWDKLRAEHPEKFENAVTPVPDPSEWFHVTIFIDYPAVNVFVNNSDKPSLTVNQLSSGKKGWIGFWVGNNSDGYFKNLKIMPNRIKCFCVSPDVE